MISDATGRPFVVNASRSGLRVPAFAKARGAGALGNRNRGYSGGYQYCACSDPFRMTTKLLAKTR
jgi:hypothetical protein